MLQTYLYNKKIQAVSTELGWSPCCGCLPETDFCARPRVSCALSKCALLGGPLEFSSTCGPVCWRSCSKHISQFGKPGCCLKGMRPAAPPPRLVWFRKPWRKITGRSGRGCYRVLRALYRHFCTDIKKHHYLQRFPSLMMATPNLQTFWPALRPSDLNRAWSHRNRFPFQLAILDQLRFLKLGQVFSQCLTYVKNKPIGLECVWQNP